MLSVVINEKLVGTCHRKLENSSLHPSDDQMQFQHNIAQRVAET